MIDACNSTSTHTIRPPIRPDATVGTMLKITSTRNLVDGRLLVSSVGTRRFVVKDLHHTDGYYSVSVDFFNDQPVSPAALEGW